MEDQAGQAETVDMEAQRRAVAAATMAPSVHNTQPWRFRLGPDTIDLFVDRERTLHALDPTGRQLVLSCGSALLFLRVALRSSGLDASVELLPDADADHLARVTVRPGSAPTHEERALAGAIDERHMQRTPFEAKEVPSDVVRKLRLAVEEEQGWLQVVRRREDQLALISLLARADEMESHDEAYRAELRAWVRTDATTEGVPTAILPEPGERHTEVVIRDFDPSRAAEEPPGADGPPKRIVDEHPLVVVLGTDSDALEDQVRAGMALGRLLLQGTVEGLSASPLGQVLDWPGPRTLLRQRLSLIGEPQLVLRVGYGDPKDPTRTTGRRPLDEVLLP
ncbi:MAG TPA: nitroreductase [Frankiaceae bacterium]|nr:nitroreductase [Frankiaceae bacterium]